MYIQSLFCAVGIFNLFLMNDSDVMSVLHSSIFSLKNNIFNCIFFFSINKADPDLALSRNN